MEKKVITHPDFTTPIQSVSSPSAEAINRRSMIKNIPSYFDPTFKPPPKPMRIPVSEGQENIDISPEIKIDYEENSLFQSGVISKTYQILEKSSFQEPWESADWYKNIYQNKLLSIWY